MKSKHIIALLAGIGIIGASIALVPQKSTSPVPVPGLYPPAGYGVTNPDISQANIKDNICNKNWSTKSIRPPSSYTTNLKKWQMGLVTYFSNTSSSTTTVPDYGLFTTEDNDPSHYEEDHFISLELGGHPTDPHNLWPQPYILQVNGENLGAREKDRVEDYLHTQVCSGAISLVEAQKAVSTDWVKVYHQMKGSKNLGATEEGISTSDE